MDEPKMEIVNVYDWHRQDTRATELNDICVTATSNWGRGGNNMPYVVLRIRKNDIPKE